MPVPIININTNLTIRGQNMDNISYKKDIFEILGVSSKEDCFTNLLAEAFNESGSEDFRDRFCKNISSDKVKIYNSEDARIYTRSVFKIESNNDNGGRSKVVPDILFVTPSQNAIIIIENKIFSDEGFKQTSAYSSIEFQNELTKQYSINNEQEYKFEYYYMTLLGEAALNDMFTSLKWTDFIINTCTGINFSRPYNILMKDMLTRAEELKDFLDIDIASPYKTFNDYLQLQRRWINTEVVFKKYFFTILENIKAINNINVEFGDAKGRAPQLLLLLYSDKWRENNLDEYKNAESIGRFEHTRNIHLEFTWHVGKDDASFMIHYETFPYHPYKKFKEKYPTIEPIYAKHRNIFKEGMHKEIESSTNWEKANSKCAIAKKSFNNFKNLNIDDFAKEFASAFNEAYILINKLLEKENILRE